MSKTVAGDNEHRLKIWMGRSVHLALVRIARRHRVTQREVLEWLIGKEDDRILAGVVPDTQEWNDYFGLERSAAPARQAVLDAQVEGDEVR